MEIYVGRIPFKWKEKNLEELFSPYSNVTNAVIEDETSAMKAINALNNMDIDGRNIIVSISNPKEKGSSGSNVRTKGRNEDKLSHHIKPAKKLPPWLRKEY